MKRNTFIRVLSAVMAAGILLGSYGCKKAEKEGSKQPEVTGKSEITSVTTVIEYTSIDSKGKEKKMTTIDTIEDPSVNKAVLGPKLSEKFSDNKEAKEKLKKNIADYGADEKKYEEIVKDAENWQTFTYDYYVANPYAKRIAFRTITSNSKDGILVNSDVGCEVGVPSGRAAYILIDGMIDKSKYPDEESIKKALSEMDICIKYTFLENADETVDDWAKADVKTMPLDFTK